MARLAIVLVATFLFTAQCAVIRNEESLKRIARSPCESCYRDGPPGPPPPPPPPPPPFFPPPPPPHFHTQQWSGYAKSSDGRQQGVFSGATAQALDGTQSGGEAYSLAASEANANTGKDSYNAQHLKDAGNDVQQIQGNGFGSPLQAQAKNSAQGSSFGRGDLERQQQNQHGFGAASASSHAQSSSSGGYSSNGKYQSNHGGSFDSQGLNDVQQVQGNGFGATTQAKAKTSYGSSRGSDFGRGDLENEQQIPSGGLENQQQIQSGFGTSAASRAHSSAGDNYGSGGKYQDNNGAENLQQQQQLGSQGLSANQGHYGGHTQYGQQQESYGFGSGSGSSGQQNSHEALKGALDLAHQGLQTPQAGCSTCGKSSYALSNAKSHNGNAVALSVSG